MLGEVFKDVATPVNLATLQRAHGTEDLSDRGAQRLRAIHDEEPSPVRIEASVEKIPEERLRHPAVLGRSLPKAQDMLLPLGIDA